MKLTCDDRERVFLDGTAEEWAALETHAANCAACGEEIRSWRNLSIAAADLHHEWDSPALWPRIEAALQQQARTVKNSGWQRLFGSWTLGSLQWQMAAAALLLVVLTSSAIWFLRNPKTPGRDQNPALLTDRAVNDVEHAEAAYERILSLPIFPTMSDKDIADTIAAVRKVVEAYSK